MGRKEKYVDYLKTIPVIHNCLNNLENLHDPSKSDKRIITYLKALDLFFPWLLNHFKTKLGEKEFDLPTYSNSNVETQNTLKRIWEKSETPNMIFEEWRILVSDEKAIILTKWKDEMVASINEDGKAKENTFLNYMWRVQGLFSKLGKEYAANPKKLQKLHSTEAQSEDMEKTVYKYKK